MLCRHDYAERVVSSFAHQIQSEYYSGNRSMSIEVIVLEHFSALPKTGINTSMESCRRHAVFHPIFLDDDKQYASTTTSYRKHLIALLKSKLLMSSLSTTW